MARLNIIQARGKFSIRIPHYILIDGQQIGIMKAKQVAIEMPEGEYDVTVQSAVQFISGTQHVAVSDAAPTDLTFRDREGVWDTLFVIDVVLWCVNFFITLPNPWNWIYQLFTNGYFVLWLIYELIIRNKYFKFDITNNQNS